MEETLGATKVPHNFCPEARTRSITHLVRILGELHRDLSYLMMGKGVSVAGADREEAPGPKPEPTGREPGSQA